ncbi:hypothetical protein [Rhodococcus sp. UNC363MFTsu5.1]|uniref:hypothetical protein n=1 Tax=Rhodococcus sp. UNC363MFTsu5.1 TaxID=1449069 RepID=UPI000481D3D0|nr:hypothetical protein [Rhodococcus sp. UNC363MFTsu5.1]
MNETTAPVASVINFVRDVAEIPADDGTVSIEAQVAANEDGTVSRLVVICGRGVLAEDVPDLLAGIAAAFDAIAAGPPAAANAMTAPTLDCTAPLEVA